ncbi:MAG: CDP-diacylglycerol--glycerol-3-phosphate 3-phosphatidyltransferase [Anaeroplasmataceae bacterium]|nr:CDP-diacylglycerol--glycerol-3-phosphate 3-phosphatidyltransferase [Anaeroplasmataceae bacterium]
MTLPNKLTIGRIMAIPAMVVIACIPYLNQNYIFLNVSYANFINVLIFALASMTDFLDGYIARKYNLVTTFGKFADPLADKMLVLTSFLILLIQNNVAKFGDVLLEVLPLWSVAIILVRELAVSGVRLVAAEKGEVIAAGWSGKVKTFVTMIAIIILFLVGLHNIMAIIGLILVYISVLLTLYSGIEYIWNSRKIIFESI